jgi:membrane protease subunit HflC
MRNAMRNTIIILIAVGVVLLVVALLGPYYIVTEGEQAVVVQFGKIVRVETDAGLKYKVPFVESVVKYSKKVQSWDGDAQRIPTSENQFIWVDTTARWRIVDPKKFYESVGSMTQAQGRLDDVIDSEVRKIIAKNPLREAVRDSDVISQIKRTNTLTTLAGSAENPQTLGDISTLADVQYEPIVKGRRALSIEMLDEARTIMPQYGMELIDVIIRQIKYSDDLTPSVYDRMIKERNQIAQFFRSSGEGEKAKWLGQTTRELLQIQSEAERQAKEIKAKADAEALNIRNKAYGQDPSFADYWMALQEYQTLLPKFNKTLSTDSDFYKYFYNRSGRPTANQR